MSDITHIERIKLEKLFEMNTGYVLNFSNRTLQDFVIEKLGIDIYVEKYSDFGESKANRLRTFWKKEENALVAKSLFALLEYYFEYTNPSSFGWSDEAQELYNFGMSLAKRLQGDLIDHIEAIKITSNDKSFDAVGKSVRQLIHENKPEEAIDRLHTYFTMFVRQLCNKHNIAIDSTKAIHSLLGEYIKHLNSQGLLESVMAERILKSTISIVDAFNDVRNNKSMAHANKLLGYDESLFIFRNVSSAIAFINSVEIKNDSHKHQPIDDLPF